MACNTVAETVWVNRDNRIRLKLYEDNIPAVLDGVVTRAQLVLGPVTIDSNSHAGAFDWSLGGGVIEINVGPHVSTPWFGEAVLILFDAINTNGVVWIPTSKGDRLTVRILP